MRRRRSSIRWSRSGAWLFSISSSVMTCALSLRLLRLGNGRLVRNGWRRLGKHRRRGLGRRRRRRVEHLLDLVALLLELLRHLLADIGGNGEVGHILHIPLHLFDAGFANGGIEMALKLSRHAAQLADETGDAAEHL